MLKNKIGNFFMKLLIMPSLHMTQLLKENWQGALHSCELIKWGVNQFPSRAMEIASIRGKGTNPSSIKDTVTFVTLFLSSGGAR